MASQLLLALAGTLLLSGHRIWMPPLALPAAALLVVVPLLGLARTHTPSQRHLPKGLMVLLVIVLSVNVLLANLLLITSGQRAPQGCEGAVVATDWVRNEVTCQVGGAHGEVLRVHHHFGDFFDHA